MSNSWAVGKGDELGGLRWSVRAYWRGLLEWGIESRHFRVGGTVQVIWYNTLADDG